MSQADIDEMEARRLAHEGVKFVDLAVDKVIASDNQAAYNGRVIQITAGSITVDGSVTAGFSCTVENLTGDDLGINVNGLTVVSKLSGGNAIAQNGVATIWKYGTSLRVVGDIIAI